MITECYDNETEAIISLKDFYGERQHIVDVCLIVFSKDIHAHLLDTYNCEIIGMLTACNGDTPIYKMNYKDMEIAFYLSGIGSAIAASVCYEASWLTGATKFIMFGSCGTLDMVASTSMKYFSRSIEDTLSAIKTYRDLGITLKCPSDNFDSNHIEMVENMNSIKNYGMEFDDVCDGEQNQDEGMCLQ